jgi:hypothetical protein
MRTILLAVIIAILAFTAFAQEEQCQLCKLGCYYTKSQAKKRLCYKQCDEMCTSVALSDAPSTCEQKVKWIREQKKYGTPRSVADLAREIGLPGNLVSKVGAGLPVELICKARFY